MRWNSNEIKFFLHTSLSLNFKQSHHLQPHTVHIQNPRWKKWGLGVEDCGNDGGEFELQVKNINSVLNLEKPFGICGVIQIKLGHCTAICRLDIKPPPNGELWGENINGSFNGLVAITYFLNVLLSSAYKSFIWWECYKEATLTLVGPTSTSSLTEPGLIKIKTSTDKDKTYMTRNQINDTFLFQNRVTVKVVGEVSEK